MRSVGVGGSVVSVGVGGGVGSVGVGGDVLMREVPPRADGGALRQPLEVGHGAVHGARVHPLARRVGRLGPVPVDDLVLVLAGGFPSLPVQQEEVDDLFRVVADGGERE